MDAGAIRDQVDKILNSQSFATKGQLRKLLEVLHENMDSQATLTTELVIQELWPAETKTKQARDVATEMNRLRRAVESYYSAEGENDRVIIYFPKRAPSRNGHSEARWIDAALREEAAADATSEPAPQTPVEAARPSAQTKTRDRPKRLALVAAMCLAILAAVAVLVFLPRPHLQPQSARLDGTVLRIMDAQGKQLWTKRFPEGFRTDWYYKKDSGPPVWFADLEGQGHVSVLFAYAPAAGEPLRSSTLICYSDRGKEKWRWTPGRNLPELNGNPAVFLTMALVVLKATPKRPLRIAAASVDPWWPTQIAILNSEGRMVSEYWHSGILSHLTLVDFYPDGGERIAATGVANGYDHQATLVVLDPDRVFGASAEVLPAFQIHGMGVAQEELRLLFPRSDLNVASLFPFNDAIEPVVQDRNLRLTVQECLAPRGCPIFYEFDKNYHLLSVSPASDEFRKTHDQFYGNGKDAHSFGLEEQSSFLKVRCLVGCSSAFVAVAETYDPARSFESGWLAQRNPDGVWSYGYSSGIAKPVTLYDRTVRNGVNGPDTKYWLSSSVNDGTSPSAEYNDGPANDDGNINLLAKEFLLVAGIGGQYSNVTFTAPVDAQYSVTGAFRGAQYGVGTVVAIVVDGERVFSSSVTSADQRAPFSFTPHLHVGSTIVFSVGPGSGFQNTGLSATVTRACDPADKPMFGPDGEIRCETPRPPKRSPLKTVREPIS